MNDKDKFVRQYDYKANSNLVLPTDTSLIDKRPSNESTGEVQSLVGRIKGKMGDRVNDNPLLPSKVEQDEKRISRKKLKSGKSQQSSLKQELADPRHASVADIDAKDLLYRPKSDLTATVYSLLIKFVRKQIGFQHNSIITCATDEVITTMKDQNFDEQTRRDQINGLLSIDEQGLKDEEYNELCNLCKRINDWDSGTAEVKDDVAEGETGDVGVILSDEDDDAQSDYLSEVKDSDDEFDLDEMFQKADEESMRPKETVLEDIIRRQTIIVPKADFGEPTRKEGYHEYNIMPKKRTNLTQDVLIKIQDMPENERHAFGEFKTLNPIQSKIYRKAISSDQSLLICAPTGAGKTNIAVLTMLREILKYQRRDGSGFDTDKFKIIYVAPIKALVQEVVENFTKRLGCKPYNLKVEELTGDHQLDQRQMSRAQIIVCTPEKWDIVTRKSLDRLYTKVVRLVIFDEIHLLHNERGATLEALVARIKRHQDIEGERIRIIGLSATLPNYKDVARFIAPGHSEEDSVFYFDSSYRPIPLKQQYIAMTESKKAFRMINDIVYDKTIERLVQPGQVLIFVHSRPDTLKTADYLKCRALEQQKIGLFLSSDSAVDKINEMGKTMSPKLKELLQFGLGTHHAGMSKHERSCVEDLFRGRFIRVLVSTATLAWGVNLPARTVIIKGTQVYRDGRWVDLDSLDVTQMLGRAGRPGFDKEGEGIVITQQSQVNFYMSLMTEQLPVESKLIMRLPEFINSECVIGNIESIKDATAWLSETYLNSRMLSVLRQNNKPFYPMYGIEANAIDNDPKLTNHRHTLAYTAACILDNRGLIVFDRISGAMRSTELGRIASHYNCSSQTIKLFNDSIHDHTSDIELFRIFSLADEFKDIFVRRGEETDLHALINQVPFPIDDKRATPGANKVNALLQVYIFRMNIEGSDLICDMHFIKESAARLARAIHEIVLMKGYASVAELSFDFCRKIDKRMTVCHTPFRQFADDLDLDLITRLEKKNYHIEELRVLKADKLSELLRCDLRQGEKIYKMLKLLPKLKIEASVKPISSNSLKIDLSILPDFSWSDKYHGYSERFWLMVEDVNQEALLHYEMVYVRKYNPSDTIRCSFFVPFLRPVHPFYYIKILPDQWFGCDHTMPIYIEKINLPDETTIITQPLDLELTTLRSLENAEFEKFYDHLFKGSNFNQIQTQAFNDLYKSDEDIVLLASDGSGKTTCAELALIRQINIKSSKAKSAYVCANQQAARVIYNRWKDMFSKHGSLVLLTGNHRIDSARVDSDSANIVVGDYESWHSLSLVRSKKHRKLMSKFDLFVFDDVHILHSDRNSAYEWLCAKVRIITKLKEGAETARIVALGAPLTCAESVKNWLARERGLREPKLFNYPPSLRPVKLDLIVQKYQHYEYRMRLMTMQRPVYRYITQLGRDKPVMVFVPDYLRAVEISDAILRYAAGDNFRFKRSASHFNSLQDPKLADYLTRGLGFIYSGMGENDKSIVEDLFDSEQIQVLVVTVSMCWSIKARCYLNIIMDTQQHNGLEARDYDPMDVIHMVGLTGRPLADHECKCILMCQHSKGNTYERLLREPLAVESELPVNLISHISYEVATGSLGQLNDIYKPYLAHTFFYKRITINPNYYGVVVPEDPDQKSKIYGTFFNELVNKVALDLEKTEFITIEGSHENPEFTAGLLAKISLEYYINYQTLANYTRWLTGNAKPLDLRSLELIELISTNTSEFEHIQVRHGELPELKNLQRRHRPRESDQLHNHHFKIKLLILSQYQKGSDGREEPLEGELLADRQFVVTLSYRLLMAIVDIAWLKDSFSLAKTAIQLAKKITSFSRSTSPNLDMETNISTADEDQSVRIQVTVNRENEPFSMQEFAAASGPQSKQQQQQTHQEEEGLGGSSLPASMYRDEGWCFLVQGKSRAAASKENVDKFVLFKRVKTPARGTNEYKLQFALPDDHQSYTYDLYLMSDFYSTREDRKVADIKI